MTEITVTTTLDTAAILALHDTPLEIVAAPGAGKILVVNDGWIRFDVGSTPFGSGSGEGVQLLWGGTVASGNVAATATNSDGSYFIFWGTNNQLVAFNTMAVGSNDEGVNAGLFLYSVAVMNPTGITDLGTAIITIIYEEIAA